MIVVLLVALAWTGAHNAAWSDNVPNLLDHNPVVHTPRRLELLPINNNGQPVAARPHAQRGDVGPSGWQERRFHGLE